MMLETQLPAAIAAARTTTVLDALAKAVWSGMAGGHLAESSAQTFAEAIEERRGELRRPPMPKPEAEPRGGVARHVARTGGQTFFARARTQRPPDRAVALARRRALAASGPMPPALAAQFTTGELAVLRTVADEIQAKGRCDRTYGELAARAGVGISTAKNAIRRAGRLELLRIALRPRPGRKNLANVLTLVSREWRAWIDRRGGAKRGEDSSKSRLFKSSVRGGQIFDPSVSRRLDAGAPVVRRGEVVAARRQ